MKLIVALKSPSRFKKNSETKIRLKFVCVHGADMLISALEVRIDIPVRVCRVVDVWIHARDICLHVSHAT